jgi:outer membrane cobalamin receptor
MLYRNTNILLFALGFAAMVRTMQAQTSDNSAAQTVVTVTAQAMPLDAAPASVTILSRDYIDTSHAENAADLLRATPFLEIAQTGASGGFTTVTIRGSKSSFTLIMIDGIPVNDITNELGGAFDLSSLPVDNIERVEIVRGPLSAIYGSEAIGGVINFISRRGSKKSLLEASGELGNFLRRQFKASASGTWKALQYSVGGSRLDVDQQVLDDGYSDSSLSFNGSVALGKNNVLDFTTRWLDDNSAGFATGSGGPEFAVLREPVSDHAKELILGSALKGQVKPWWTYTLNLDWIRRTDDNNTPGIYDKIPPGPQSVPPSVSNTDFKRTRFNAGSRFALSRDLALAIGANVTQEDGSTLGTLAVVLPQSFTLGRTTFLGTAGLEYSNSHISATAGLSFNKSEGFGEVTSPRLGLNWLTTEKGPRFKTSWAKGFEMPSFYAEGNPIVGNQSLRPERANSFEAGLEQVIHPANLAVSGTYFRNNFTDLVGFDSTVFRLENLSKALTEGGEFGVDWAPNAKVGFGLDISYLVWILPAGSQPLRNLPHGNGGVHLEWKPSAKFRARAETQWMGRRYDYEVPVPYETSVGGYSNTSISADYNVNAKFSLYLRGDNLFDSKFHEFIGFPNPGITVRVGVSVHSQPR